MAFSAQTQRFYKLLETETWPTIEISGIRMHRVETVDPKTDTELKLKAIAPIFGKVLDCCTGLGYTAIGAALAAKVTAVMTVELDENVVAMAKKNDSSRELFCNAKIERVIGDITEIIEDLPAGEFDRIIHDPPSLTIAGDLYSEDFYRHLFRVLRRGGRLYHYTGAPGRSQGKDIVTGVLRRLQKAGFIDVKRLPSAAGVIARKR